MAQENIRLCYRQGGRVTGTRFTWVVVKSQMDSAKVILSKQYAAQCYEELTTDDITHRVQGNHLESVVKPGDIF